VVNGGSISDLHVEIVEWRSLPVEKAEPSRVTVRVVDVSVKIEIARSPGGVFHSDGLSPRVDRGHHGDCECEQRDADGQPSEHAARVGRGRQSQG
jgi:hypothetical protein